MKRVFVTFLILAILVMYSQANECKYSGFDHFDYFAFTQVWPRTECILNSQSCVESLVNPHFSISSLRPMLIAPISNYSGPQCCKVDEKYSLQFLSSIYDLNFHWSDVNDQADEVWRDNWRRYGTCIAKSLAGFTLNRYFNAALKLYSRMNILPAILAARAFPNNNRHINGTKFIDMLSQV